MNYYDEDILLEKKEEDDEDDGLLSHGIKKEKKKSKKDQLYDDWNNKRIMSGKAKGSRALYDKEERAKNTIKRVAKSTALIGGAAIAINAHKKSKDPVGYQMKKSQHANERAEAQRMANQDKATAVEIKTEGKRLKSISKKEGKRSADAQAAADKLTRNAKRKEEIIKRSKETGQKPGFFTRHKYGISKNELNEELLISLFENFTEEQLLNYFSLEESKADKEAYKQYSKRMKQVDSEPLSYKEWKKKKYGTKKKIKKLLVAGGAAVVGANEYRHTKNGDPNFVNRMRNSKLNSFMKNSGFRNAQNKKISKNHEETRIANLHEELNGMTKEQILAYLERLNDETFMKNSYNQYCIMMESRGLTPLDESVFENVKKKIGEYSKAAVDGIKQEYERKEAEKKKKEKEKKEAERKKREQEIKEEKEKLSKMTPEERKEYFLKKRKEQEKKEEEEQNAKDIKKIAKQSFVRGATEKAGGRLMSAALSWLPK